MLLKTPPALGSMLAAALLMGLAGCSQAQSPNATAATAAKAPAAATGNYPAVLKGIQKHGFEVVGEFDAPGGLRGFAGVVGGQQPAAAYVTPDGKHVVVGSLFDENGEDVGAAPLEKLAAKPMSEKMWKKLDASTWVRDGRADAPRVVYTFSDANCPYCHRFWEAARPWVDGGKVQLRHIMVGVIREDSPAKAAAILTASNPSAALLENEHRFDKGGIKPVAALSADIANKLNDNQELMIEMGFQGTPGILFKDDKGMLQRRSGMPQGQDMDLVMGKR
ncbi:thiol:disulfide interchange protein DsbG [Bacillus subtilis subsp. subtilis]|nr:thiol:disulfide interchange protein DsbG [Bacillus subtilis subsp. subtilis]